MDVLFVISSFIFSVTCFKYVRFITNRSRDTLWVTLCLNAINATKTNVFFVYDFVINSIFRTKSIERYEKTSSIYLVLTDFKLQKTGSMFPCKYSFL